VSIFSPVQRNRAIATIEQELKREEMATNRLDALKQMVAQDPNNSFARYGLAMELTNSNMPGEAIAEFKTLMANDGTYVAAFYHCGQALEKLGNIDEARSVYRNGIEASLKKGDAHTRAEIEAALSLLPI
jgi:predicted Zn-dependent protease